MSEQQFTPYYQGQHYGAPYQQQYNRPLAPQGQYYQGKGNSPYVHKAADSELNRPVAQNAMAMEQGRVINGAFGPTCHNQGAMNVALGSNNRAINHSNSELNRGSSSYNSGYVNKEQGGQRAQLAYHALGSYTSKAQVINLDCKCQLRELSIKETFGESSLKSFKLPVFDQSLASLIPKVDPHYVFNQDNLNLILRHLQAPHSDSLFICGPTGCGKTSFILQIAARLLWPVESITLSQSSEVADLIGHTVLRQGQLAFEYGPLSRAMMFGEILLLNEVDLMSAGELAALNDVLEGRALTVNANNGEVIYPHPFFRVVVTANSKGSGDNSGHYMGVRKQNKAFLDRYVFVEFDYPDYEQEQSMLLKGIAHFNPDLVKYFITFANEIRYGSGSGYIKSNQEILDTMKSRIAKQYQEYEGSLEEVVSKNLIPSIQEIINDNASPLSTDAINEQQKVDNLELSDLDDMHESLRLMSAPISVPLSNRALLRICRYFVNNPLLSVADAINQAFASRLDYREFAFVMRMCFEIFGYNSEFSKLPRQIDDVESYLKVRKNLISSQVLERLLLPDEQVRILSKSGY